jgi:hypothetical protein
VTRQLYHQTSIITLHFFEVLFRQNSYCDIINDKMNILNRINIGLYWNRKFNKAVAINYNDTLKHTKATAMFHLICFYFKFI